jgi:hypothetical protein
MHPPPEEVHLKTATKQAYITLFSPQTVRKLCPYKKAASVPMETPDLLAVECLLVRT